MQKLFTNVFPSPFYRVTTRALIFNEHQQLLVFRNSQGIWEIPGGGLEHDETVETCLIREVREEIGVRVASVGDTVGIWRSANKKYGYMQLRIGVRVQLASNQFEPSGEAEEIRFVTKKEFLELPLEVWEDGIKDLANVLWKHNKG